MNTQLELDFTKAEINKANGLGVALFHAESKGYLDEAKAYFADFLQTHSEFMAEDFKKYAIDRGMNPESWKFLGAFFASLSKKKIIQFVDFKQRTAPSSHASRALLWRKI